MNRARAIAAGLVATAGVLSGVGACNNRSYGPPLPPHTVTAPTHIDAGTSTLALAHMSLVAQLRDRAVGPLLAQGPDGALVAYVAGGGAGARPVVAVPLHLDGSPAGPARTVAQAAPDTSALVVRRVSTGDAGVGGAGGYLLAWVSLTDRGESISIVGVSDKGEPRGAALELARTPDHVAWVEIVPTARGGVCVWAEEPPTGGANVLAQALDTSGKPRGVPSRIARGATGWQAIAADGGVAVGVVQGARALALVRLDTEARAVGDPLPVARNVGDDMDMVRVGGNPDGDNASVVIAWTDRSRADAALVMASVDAQNKIVAAHDALPDAGTSSLVALARGSAGTSLVVWESARKREHVKRRVQAALLHDGKSPLDTRTTLDVAGGAALEAHATATGYALLVTARACPANGKTPCAPPSPTYIRLDATLAPVETEALVQGPTVTLAWSLDCGAGACLALAAGPDVPTQIYAVDLAPRPSTHAPPLAPVLPEDAPRLVAASTLAGGTQVGDLATTKLGDTTLVAAVVGTGTDDKTHEEHAALRIVAVTAAGRGQTPVTLSTKALATGGVAMVHGPAAGEATVAYVARDGAAAHVHLARIDAHGARKGELVLAGGAKGDASDVSIVAIPEGGFVVAWVDTRDGNGEVYSARVPASFAAPAREERITNAPGDATDTALAILGGNVYLAWADPRESPHDGFADIYAVTLASQTGKPLATGEGRVLSTAAHSRSPSLAPTPQGIALAWIEEAPGTTASEEAKGAMFVTLDDHARPVRAPIKLRLRDEGIATAIVLDTTNTRLVHAIVARSAQDELWLDAAHIPLDPAGALDSYPLLVLDGPASLDVALALDGENLLFSDDGPNANDARVRRGQIAWKKKETP